MKTGHHDDVERVIAEPLRRAEVALDDVHAARLAARIEEAFEDQGRPRTARPPGRARRWMAVGLAGAALTGAAALAWLFTAGAPSRESTRSAPLSLVPYFYSGDGPGGAPLTPAPRQVVTAGARMRAVVGARARVTLVGPAAVAAATVDGVTELTLEHGLLLADYDGSAGGMLRVRASGVTTTIVGTLFAVDASGAHVRVGVARGTVTVQSAGHSLRVAAGQCWTQGDAGADAGAGALPDDLVIALAEHEHSLGQDAPSTRGAPVAVAAGEHQAAQDPLRRVIRDVVRRSTAPPIPAQAAGAPAAMARPDPPDEDREAAPHGDAAAGAQTEYLAAEAALRAGETERGRNALRDLVQRHPQDALAEAALVDLARLALAAGDRAEARRNLTRLNDPTHDPALVEPARHLRCEIEVQAGARADAIQCLIAFRRAHPSSAHDGDVLAQLATLTERCADARPLLEEYRRRYPTGAFAAQIEARRRACQDDGR